MDTVETENGKQNDTATLPDTANSIDKDTTSKPKKQTAVSKDGTNTKIKDFGEKIGGARKDVVRQRIKDSMAYSRTDLVIRY